MSGIDLLSSVPLYVETFFGEQPLSRATGFTWFASGRLSLITNWHVVTGRNHETGKPLAAHGGVPDRLRVAFPRKERRIEPIWLELPVVDADGRPFWLEHPTHGSSVDAVALPIDAPPALEEVWFMPVNLVPHVAIKQRVGMPVFILGYPFGRVGMGMPVWKQGSFASEPFLAPDFDRFLIVDTASRPGMSGSPVIQRSHGQVELEGEAYGRTEDGDGAFRFVGIYSGRFHTNDAEDAQLGRVWPARLVEEIVAQRAPASRD